MSILEVKKEYYPLLKEALMDSYHHQVCKFNDNNFTIERLNPTRDLISIESTERINNWSWAIVHEFLKRITEKDGMYERRISNASITRVIEQKFSAQYENYNYFALCEYTQRIWTVSPTSLGVGAETPCDDFKGEGIFFFSDKEQSFVLWDDAPTWESIEGISYEMFEMLNHYEPFVKYLDYCIKNYEGKTSIYQNESITLPLGYENTTCDCDCDEYLTVKRSVPVE